MLRAHRGGKVVEMEMLKEIETPDGTDSWCPIPHYEAAKRTIDALQQDGFQLDCAPQFALARGGAEMFGVLSVKADFPGLNFSVGIRNAHNKEFAFGLCAGSHVLVCDNLAFSGDVVVRRRHTTFILDDLDEIIRTYIPALADRLVSHIDMIQRFQIEPISVPDVALLAVQAAKQDIIPDRMITRVVDEFERPHLHEFLPRTVWSAFNAFTWNMKELPTETVSRRTAPLQKMLNDQIKNLN